MKCPSCKTGTLKQAYLEELLPCNICDNCDGHWIQLEDYFRWKELKTANKNDATEINVDIVALSDTKKALVCPVTGKLMLKYRISKESDHRLDLSPYANAVWLDKGEWLLLKQQGLANQINRIFTDPWQKKIREAVSKETLEQLYREKLGEQDYEKVKEINSWLSDHPHADFIKAYIMTDRANG